MTGTLAQIIALTTYGNAYVKNGTIPDNFSTANTTFQFCNKIDFWEFRKRFFFSKPKEEVIAGDPAEWFEYLKAGGCRHLRLYFEHSKDQSQIKDYKMSGFVGGGGTWFIEAIYDKYSNYWTNRWQANEKATDNKVWTVSYGTILTRQRTINLQIDNEGIKSRLRQTLAEIADFAFKQDLQDWGERFETAKIILESASPEENYYHKDLIPLDNYSLTAKQVLFSAGSAWVFGGMGSWNDLGFESKEDNDTYDRLSEQLYSDINEAIIATVNTY